MAYKALITVGGVELPQPSKYVGTTSTVVDSARNVAGYVVGAVIREGISKVEADFNYLTAAQLSSILKLFSAAHGGAFFQTVEYFDQVENDWVTKQMYVGDRTTSGAHKLDPTTGAIVGWQGAHLSLVEV